MNEINLINLFTVALNVGLLIANLVVLGFIIKLYTEYFKDRSISKREAKP